MTLLADPTERAGAPVVTSGDDKAERARAVLRRAEERTGVRRHRPVVTPAVTAAPVAVPRADAARPADVSFTDVPVTDGSSLPARPAPVAPAEGPVRARGRHVAMGDASREVTTDERAWPVHDALAPLLPLGGLQRGTVVAVRGSTSLLLALVARPSRAGAWTAAVGFPAVGLLAAADVGADLDRVVLVPRPGPDAALAIAALVDGLDVVVVGPDAALTDTDRRRLTGRARERGALLVAATAWPGAHVALTVTGGGWSGADRGAGWLRRRTLVVERAGRGGAARPTRVEVDLPLAHEDWPAFLAEPEPVSAGDLQSVGSRDDEYPALSEPGGPGLRLVG
ncbi:hypothetical protein [Cellulosimicrobium protaetiae]|uniref:Uncharacterized protein n=1 Tax=Cellulosimicrobium protaetiae TaxID=2587808 RepID=A0A6M5UDF5_9MICO|nr:hypothetical protein [Cellulosimicrobium protaetiae]QJW36607.1 hypothetical protein FIC82_010795 [Cellulosimicrobium protaetiae]